MQYLNEKQVAELTGRSVSTLRNERSMRRGMPFIKVGRSVRYNKDDVTRFMESRKVITAEA